LNHSLVEGGAGSKVTVLTFAVGLATNAFPDKAFETKQIIGAASLRGKRAVLFGFAPIGQPSAVGQ
jgi:hypothetical protein